jgi:3-oxoacyl-[acyl-carrier-protein] synthase-3
MSGLARHALIIGSELLTRFLDWTDRNTCVLFGDGAGAVVVSASDEPGGGMSGLELTADPDGAWSIWIPAGGARRPATPATVAGAQQFLRMDGRATYRYATRTIASTALKAIERAGWTADQVDLFIPHQANARIIESVAAGLGIPMERIYLDLDRYGNTSAASVPIALAEAVDEGRVRAGDRILFVAFGAGFTSGAAAITWTADPADGRRASGAGVAPIHQPSDWDGGDPVPEPIARILAAKQQMEVPA